MRLLLLKDRASDILHRRGATKIQVNLQNPAKFKDTLKYRELCQKSYQIHVDFSQATIINGHVSLYFVQCSPLDKINLYPLNNAIGFPNIYPLDSGLSNG